MNVQLYDKNKVRINAPYVYRLTYKLQTFPILLYNAFMQINNIQENSFKGKVKFNKKLTKPMVEYANKILDQPFSGTTARERIAKSSYDLEINDKIEECYLCDECYQERVDAI